MYLGFSYQRTGGSSRQKRKRRTTQKKERPLAANLERQRDPSVVVSPTTCRQPKNRKPRLDNWFERLPSLVQLILAVGIFTLLLLIGMRPEAAGAIILVLTALKQFFFSGDEPPQDDERNR